MYYYVIHKHIFILATSPLPYKIILMFSLKLANNKIGTLYLGRVITKCSWAVTK